ncbi:MAG: hypothetical protein HY392_01335 [Candidatus Diapherotrites archaeon]|nr:hypothetical protein [Candidatus Diapherotrites archaeon]
MYHVGRVLRIIGNSDDRAGNADNSIQVHLEMWDENQVIVLLHPALNSTIKEKDVVLVHYTQPEPVVVRVFKAKEGKELWEIFSDYFSQRKALANKQLFRDNPAGRMIG